MRKNIYLAPEVSGFSIGDIIQSTIEVGKEVEKVIKELLQVLDVLVGVLVYGVCGFVGYIFILFQLLFKLMFQVLLKDVFVWFKVAVSRPCQTYFFVFFDKLYQH